MKYDFSAVVRELSRAGSILILTHSSADGDAVGSSVAAGLALKAMGKRVSYVVEKDKYGLDRFLEEMSCFGDPLLESYDLALCLDCSTFDYMYGNEYVSRCGRKLVIDHHKTNTGYGDVNLVDGTSASCGEIVFELIKHLGIPVSRQMAHALYLALSTDTGNFMYSNTNSRTFELVAELYGLYDDYYLIADRMRFAPMKALELMRVGLSSLLISDDGHFAVIRLIYDMGYSDRLNIVSDSLLDVVRYTEGIKVTVLVRQTGEDAFKISLRSTDDAYDVSVLAAQMGGGGHEKAAGFSFEGPYAELEKKIREYYGF
ncbi:MAG: bifunctional oligoribonuclease/PAP phosphatase NrnA [Eubacteriaceae bacterium]|nr:bifunctional oligoribonuclease/PAP phosphatase NrnA [Eubacteriaceae bacterium]